MRHNIYEVETRKPGAPQPVVGGRPDLEEWRRRAVYWADLARKREKELENLRAEVKARLAYVAGVL